MLKTHKDQSNREILDDQNSRTELSTLFDFTDGITSNKRITDTESAFLTVNSVNKVMAFVEYGLQEGANQPRCSYNTTSQGASEIIRACRVITTRVEVFLQSIMEEEEQRQIEASRKT